MQQPGSSEQALQGTPHTSIKQRAYGAWSARFQ